MPTTEEIYKILHGGGETTQPPKNNSDADYDEMYGKSIPKDVHTPYQSITSEPVDSHYENTIPLRDPVKVDGEEKNIQLNPLDIFNTDGTVHLNEETELKPDQKLTRLNKEYADVKNNPLGWLTNNERHNEYIQKRDQIDKEYGSLGQDLQNEKDVLKHKLYLGGDKLGQLVTSTPGYVADVIQKTSNMMQGPAGIATNAANDAYEQVTKDKSLKWSSHIPDLGWTNHFDKAEKEQKEILNKINPNENKSVIDQFKQGDWGGAVSNAVESTVEGLPSLAYILGLSAIAPEVGIPTGITSLAAGVKHDMDKDPNAAHLSDTQKTMISTADGTIQMLLMNLLGSGAVVKSMANMVKGKAKDVAIHDINQTLVNGFEAAAKKNTALSLTQQVFAMSAMSVSTDVVNKYGGYTPDMSWDNILKRGVESGITAIPTILAITGAHKGIGSYVRAKNLNKYSSETDAFVNKDTGKVIMTTGTDGQLYFVVGSPDSKTSVVVQPDHTSPTGYTKPAYKPNSELDPKNASVYNRDQFVNELKQKQQKQQQEQQQNDNASETVNKATEPFQNKETGDIHPATGYDGNPYFVVGTLDKENSIVVTPDQTSPTGYSKPFNKPTKDLEQTTIIPYDKFVKQQTDNIIQGQNQASQQTSDINTAQNLNIKEGDDFTYNGQSFNAYRIVDGNVRAFQLDKNGVPDQELPTITIPLSEIKATDDLSKAAQDHIMKSSEILPSDATTPVTPTENTDNQTAEQGITPQTNNEVVNPKTEEPKTSWDIDGEPITSTINDNGQHVFDFTSTSLSKALKMSDKINDNTGDTFTTEPYKIDNPNNPMQPLWGIRESFKAREELPLEGDAVSTESKPIESPKPESNGDQTKAQDQAGETGGLQVDNNSPEPSQDVGSSRSNPVNDIDVKSGHLTDSEKVIEKKFNDELTNNYEHYKKKYIEQFGREIGADNVKELSPDYRENRTGLTKAVHEPSSIFAKRLFNDLVTEPTPEGFDNVVRFTAGGTGSGKTSITRDIDKFSNIKPVAIYDSNFNSFDGAVDKINFVLDQGKKAEIVYVYRDPMNAFTNGVIPRMQKEGRSIPINIHVETHVNSLENVKKLHDLYKENKNIWFKLFDNDSYHGKPSVIKPEDLSKLVINAKKLDDDLRTYTEVERKGGILSPEQHRALAGSDTLGFNSTDVRGDNARESEGDKQDIGRNESQSKPLVGSLLETKKAVVNPFPPGFPKKLKDVLRHEPNNSTEHVLQFIANGNRFDKASIIHELGNNAIKEHGLNFIAVNKGGAKLDTFWEGTPWADSFGNGNTGIDQIIDILKDYPNVSRAAHRLHELITPKEERIDPEIIRQWEQSTQDRNDVNDISDEEFKNRYALSDEEFVILNNQIANDYVNEGAENRNIEENRTIDTKVDGAGIDQGRSPGETIVNDKGTERQESHKELTPFQQSELDKQLKVIDTDLKNNTEDLSKAIKAREKKYAELSKRNGLFGDNNVPDEGTNKALVGDFVFNKNTVGNVLKPIDEQINILKNNIESLTRKRKGVIDNAGNIQDLFEEKKDTNSVPDVGKTIEKPKMVGELVNKENRSTFEVNKQADDTRTGSDKPEREPLEKGTQSEGIHKTIEASNNAGSNRTVYTPEELEELETRGINPYFDKQIFRKKLTESAKQNGVLLPESYLSDKTLVHDKKEQGTSENDVYMNSDGKSVTKVNDLSYVKSNGKYENLDSFIDRINSHNNIFPDVAYTIKGFINNKRGQISIVLEQPFIRNTQNATQEEINIDLSNTGFKLDGTRPWSNGHEVWSNGKYDLFDARPANVLKGDDGVLYYIDTFPHTVSEISSKNAKPVDGVSEPSTQLVKNSTLDKNIVHEKTGKIEQNSSIQTQINWSETLPFKRAENAGAIGLPGLHPTDEIRGEGNNTKPSDDIVLTNVERQMTEQGHLTFMGEKLTGTAKINSGNDVAYLFKNLETASTENAFTVFVDKNGEYKVLYLGTASTSGIIIDHKLIIAAAKEFNATKICLVHNHPSGNLQASKSDIGVHKTLSDIGNSIGVNVMPSVIINLDSGNYAEINHNKVKTWNKKPVEGNKDVSVFQFDRQKLYVPSSEKTVIGTSKDIAEFLSKQKRGVTGKIHAIVLDRRNAINKYLLYDGDITTQELTKRLLQEIGKHGESVVLATNGVKLDLQNIQKGLSSLGDSILMDVLDIKQDDDIIEKYKSFRNSGLLEPETKYGNEKPQRGTVGEAVFDKNYKKSPENTFESDNKDPEKLKTEIQQYYDSIGGKTPTTVISSSEGLAQAYIDNGGKNLDYIEKLRNEKQNIQAVYLHDIGRSIVIGSEVKSNPDSMWIHENGIHSGLRITMGDKAAKMMQKVFDSVDKKSIYDALPSFYHGSHDTVIANEFLAYLAENRLEKGLIDVNDRFTPDELTDLLNKDSLSKEDIFKLINTFVSNAFNNKSDGSTENTQSNNLRRPERPEKAIGRSNIHRENFGRRIGIHEPGNKEKGNNSLDSLPGGIERIQNSKIENVGDLVFTTKEKPTKPLDEPLFKKKRFDSNGKPVVGDIVYGGIRKGDKDYKPFVRGIDKVVEVMQNKMLSVEKLQGAVKKFGGKISIDSNPYIAENLSYGRVRNAQENFEKDLAEPIIESVKDFVKNGASLDDVGIYMMAKHAPERNLHFRDKYENVGTDIDYSGIADANVKFSKSGMAPDEIANEIVTQFEMHHTQTQIDKFWQDIKKATDFRLERNFSDGLISKKTFDYFKGRWEHYVPLIGYEKTAEDLLHTYNVKDHEGQINLSDPIITAEGRPSVAQNPLGYIFNMANSAILHGEKNRIYQAVFEMIKDNRHIPEVSKMMDFKKVYVVKVGTTTDGKPIKQEQVEKPDQILFDQGLVDEKHSKGHLERKPDNQGEQHEVTVFVNGEKYVMTFQDENVARSLNNQNQLSPTATRIAQSTIGKVTRMMSQNFTAKNIEFIPANQMRDIGFASDSNFITGGLKKQWAFTKEVGLFAKIPGASLFFSPVMDAIRRGQSGKFDPNNNYDVMYKEFKENGGQTGFKHLNDVDYHYNQIQRLLKHATGDYTIGNTNNNIWTKTKNASQYTYDLATKNYVSKHMGQILDHYAERSEDLSRFAQFVISRKSGNTAKESAYDAKEITVNFNRGGKATGLIGAFYSFFNAAIQGTATFIKLFKNHPVRTISHVTLKYAAFGALTAYFCSLFGGNNDDDNEYWNLAKYVRYNYLVLPGFKKGQFITQPLPEGFRMFHALGVMAVEAMMGKTKMSDITWEALSNISASASPIDVSNMTDHARPLWFTPTIPFADVFDNKDFAGRVVHKTPFTEHLKNEYAKSGLGLKSVNPVVKSGTDWLFKQGGGEIYPTGNRMKTYGTDTPAKEVPSMMDFNPSNIEHVAEGYLGGRGMFYNKIIKTSVNIAHAIESKDMSKINVNQIPVLSRFYRQAPKHNYMQDFYNIKTDVDEWDSRVKNYKENDIEKSNKLYSDDIMYQKQQIIKSASNDLKYLNDVLTDGDNEGTPLEKARIESRTQIMKDALKKIKLLENKK